jgi:hypothetical protein
MGLTLVTALNDKCISKNIAHMTHIHNFSQYFDELIQRIKHGYIDVRKMVFEPHKTRILPNKKWDLSNGHVPV